MCPVRGVHSKRFIILVAVVVSMMVYVPLQQAEGGGKVLLIPREAKLLTQGPFYLDFELMITKEVGVMVSMLKEAGFEVEVATVSGQPVVKGSATLKPDLKLADVKTADYAGIIMPSMAVGSFPGPPVAFIAARELSRTGISSLLVLLLGFQLYTHNIRIQLPI